MYLARRTASGAATSSPSAASQAADRGGGSTLQSLARGTGAVEVDYLNGEIVWLGRQHGVPTPANELVRRVANEMARAGAPPRSITARELLDQLDES